MYYLIQNAPVRWPDKTRHGISVSDEAKDLISKMLEKDRYKRLGRERDVNEILEHPWFADLKIQDVLDKKLQAPFVPQVKSELDLQNFDKNVVKKGNLEESMISKASVTLVKQKGDKLFEGFGPVAGEKFKKKSGEKSKKAHETVVEETPENEEEKEEN